MLVGNQQATATLPQPAPMPVPDWATERLPDAEMVFGCELKVGDVVLVKAKATPRELVMCMGQGRWHVLVQMPYSPSFSSTFTFADWKLYPTQRYKAPAITQIRVGGMALDVGDVVDFSTRKTTKHVRILTIDKPCEVKGKGYGRQATLVNVDTGEEYPYFFNNFGLMDFRVVNGPKLAAAQADPSRVEQVPLGWHWRE